MRQILIVGLTLILAPPATGQTRLSPRQLLSNNAVALGQGKGYLINFSGKTRPQRAALVDAFRRFRPAAPITVLGANRTERGQIARAQWTQPRGDRLAKRTFRKIAKAPVLKILPAGHGPIQGTTTTIVGQQLDGSWTRLTAGTTGAAVVNIAQTGKGEEIASHKVDITGGKTFMRQARARALRHRRETRSTLRGMGSDLK